MAKSKRLVFNKGVLDRLPVPESGRIYVYDAKVRGLAICITATGLKTFYLYARMDRKPTRYRIGAWPEVSVAQARDIAMKRLAEMEAQRAELDLAIADLKAELADAEAKGLLSRHAA